MTVVGPSADSPANRTQPFTWALATGKRYSIPRRPPPSMVSGARSEPSRPDTLAPMRARGSRTRSMGRRRIEASPSSTDRKGSPASSPASSRIPVPELPTSSVPSAGSRALPPTRRVHGPSSATVVPRASMIRRVQATSSPSLRPRIVDVPSARPASISTRCEIDLSPGTRTRPTNGPPGSTTWVLTGRPSRQGSCGGPVALSHQAALQPFRQVGLHDQQHHAPVALGRVGDLHVVDVHVQVGGQQRDGG